MVIKMHNSQDEIYVKPETIDAIIPNRDDGGNLLYVSLIINGKEYKTDCNPLLLITSKMRNDW